MTSVSTILLVDDHAIVREGYRSLLQKQPHLQVIAEASNGNEAYRLFKQFLPDLTIMDLSMPSLGGLEAIKRICAWRRGARILVFSMHQDAPYALQAIRAGARGYVTKSSPPSSLVRSVFDALAGRITFSQDIERDLALGSIAETEAPLEQLSSREFEVLRMLMAQYTLDEIAGALSLSRKTIANTHYLIKTKLGASTDIALTMIALRHGLLNENGLRVG